MAKKKDKPHWLNPVTSNVSHNEKFIMDAGNVLRGLNNTVGTALTGASLASMGLWNTARILNVGKGSSWRLAAAKDALMGAKAGLVADISNFVEEPTIDNAAQVIISKTGSKDLTKKSNKIVNLVSSGFDFDDITNIQNKKEGGDVNKLSSNQDYIYSRLTEDYQLQPKQAIAIIANLTHESGLNTEALGDKGASYGIQQWKGPRREALEAFSSGRGHDAPDLDDQIDFLMNEYNNGKAFQFNTKGKNLYRSKKAKGITDASDYYQFSKAEFDNASSLYDATIAWNQGVGRPHKKWAMNDRRYNIAQNLAKRYDIEDDAKSLYFDQGYSDTQIESNMLPNVDIVASKPEQIQSDFMTNYGNNIVAQAIAISKSNNKVIPEVKEIEQDVQEYTRGSEEDRRAEFLNSFLPNIQLKVKGVTQVRG